MRIDLLEDLPCKTCDNLNYWDGAYFCKKSLHQNKDGSLSKRKFKKCKEYKFRVGKRIYCDGIDCVFWCNDCEAYKNRNRDVDDK